MKKLKVKVLASVFYCLILLFVCAPARAALVSVNSSFGIDSITQDTATGLEWLDITHTVGLSVNNVLGGAGGFLVAGFSIATVAQQNTLWGNAGIVPNSVDIANRGPAITLLSLIGCTASTTGLCNPVAVSAEEWSQNGIVASGLDYLLRAVVVRPFDKGGTFSIGTASPDQSGTNGVFLVRETTVVPLPAAFSLFAGGLGLLGLFGWRRKRLASAAA